MRFMVLFKINLRELQRTLHPHMVVSLKIDGVPSIWCQPRPQLLFLIIMTFFASMLIISSRRHPDSSHGHGRQLSFRY